MASALKFMKMSRVLDEDEAVFTRKSPDFDLTINIEGRRLYAPKVLLRLASPVFRKMLEAPFREKEASKVDLPEKKYDDFVMFLSCLHTGSTNCFSISEGHVYKILPLAHEYQVAGLLKTCEMTLLYILQDVDKTIGNVTRFNFLKDKPLVRALHAVESADFYDLTEAINIGAAVISKANPKELQKNEYFTSLTANTQSEVYRMGFELFFGKTSGLY